MALIVHGIGIAPFDGSPNVERPGTRPPGRYDRPETPTTGAAYASK